jgi:hypothetical protein
MDQMELDEDRDRWRAGGRALVNAIINIWVP